MVGWPLLPGRSAPKKPKVKGLLEAVPLIDFLKKIRARETITHNSLLQQAIHEWPGFGPFCGAGRDPPPTRSPTDRQPDNQNVEKRQGTTELSGDSLVNRSGDRVKNT